MKMYANELALKFNLDLLFRPSNAFYPILDASLSEKSKIKKFVLYTVSLNFLSALVSFILRSFLLIIFKSNFLKIRYPKCEIAPDKSRSSDLFIEIKLFSLKFKYNISYRNPIHDFVNGLVTSSISPFTVLLFYYISILLRININFIQYLYKLNPIFLSLLENSLKYDLMITKSFISCLEIKKFTHSGWFSVKGSILFKVLKSLNIESKVYAHGHLSQPSLAFYYPIESSKFVVFTKEELIRLEKIISILNDDLKDIDYIMPNFKIDEEKIKNSLEKASVILIGFSTPDFLKNILMKRKYNFLVESLLNLNYRVL